MPGSDDLVARPAIEADDMDPTRQYIPLPGGWEVQTRGSGSSYRLLDRKAGERRPILGGDPDFVQAFVTRMALEVHAAVSAALASRDKEIERLAKELASVERELDEAGEEGARADDELGKLEARAETAEALAATATRERDEARADLNRTEIRFGLARERYTIAERKLDEARAEVAEFSGIMVLLLQEATSQRGASWNLRSGNAPGHGHSIPGVWDSDNGELAGKPCVWCALWRKGLEAVHAHARIWALEEEAGR